MATLVRTSPRSGPQHDSITEEPINDGFGPDADEEAIPRITDIDSECYMLLMQFMNGESFDIVSNVPRGRGMEASRLLSRRWDPAIEGRRKNLLRAVLQPGRSMEELSASLENCGWISSEGMSEAKGRTDVRHPQRRHQTGSV